MKMVAFCKASVMFTDKLITINTYSPTHRKTLFPKSRPCDKTHAGKKKWADDSDLLVGAAFSITPFTEAS
jgi:hypothetical protein